ncbi:acyltransferase-like [Coffea arabica]|uniref:Acyltransferase-like n=1 Tax=Coffea arabica TaxID=13443 RepID=A0ABM4UG75_COFAR
MSLKDSSLLEILSERLIKPFSPTPPSLRSYKLSRKDQMVHTRYVPWAFFYPADNNPEGKDRSSLTETETFELLQTSLSKTLAYYYPFAGRLKNNSFVDCNDMGVQLTEARIKCSMLEILKQENSHLKDLVFPRLFFTDVIPTECSLLIVQVSFFNCGGVAVALCASHKVMDASTTCNFMNDWSSMARTLNDHVPTPLFNGASLFPPIEDSKCSSNNELKAPKPPESCITRRFLFQSAKIDELKNIAVNSSGVCNPTRYEVVTALLFRCAVAAAKANSGSFQPSMLSNTVNLRRLTVPPLPKDFFFFFNSLNQTFCCFINLIPELTSKAGNS